MNKFFTFLVAFTAFTLAAWSFSATAASTCSPHKKGNHRMIKLHTNFGVITLELDETKAPVTVKNFLDYAKSGHYDNTVFHRVIKGFMIQGGGFTNGMKEKDTGKPIANEAKNGLKNKRGTIAMARTSDPHSATAQFFLNVSDNGFLDYPGQDGWGYCVFGHVTEGLEVMDKIEAVRTGRKSFHQDVPVEDVVIERAEIC